MRRRINKGQTIGRTEEISVTTQQLFVLFRITGNDVESEKFLITGTNVNCQTETRYQIN